MDRNFSVIEIRNESSMMEYSENAIYDIQSILRSKVGDTVAVIKKAMDIEEFLYREALYKSGKERTGNVWESIDSLNIFIESIENIKKILKAKDGDWTKLFSIAEPRQFYLQLTTARTQKKKVFTLLFFSYLLFFFS